ncbi:MAG: hypothetical protein FWC36_07425 [Spirochaetes bacterium]|nr:hypothetical protein [Spirochaetota bacterium]
MIFIFISITGCASLETTLGTNIDTESNTYELAMGYRSEGTFNLLAFGNIGFLMENPARSFVYTIGLSSEYYFTNVIGISGRLGYRNIRYSSYRDGPRTTSSGLLMQLGLPFSWTHGKITPYVGVTFYETPRMNFGISLALRNEAVAVFLYGLILAMSAFGETDEETPGTSTTWPSGGSGRGIRLSANQFASSNFTSSVQSRSFTFPVVQGTRYHVWLYDWDANRTMVDAVISAHYSDGTMIFSNVDMAWSRQQQFQANRNDTVTLTVAPRSRGHTGNFSVAFNTSGIRPLAPR